MNFKYLRPANLDEACLLLSQHEDAKLIAGGQSLLQLLKQKLLEPEYVIDIKNLDELDYIKVENDCLLIGAMTTQREIETSSIIKDYCPVLSEMAYNICDTQIRNWGTIGGNLCHADPVADPAPALLVLGAFVKVKSVRGERVIPLNELFVDFFETSMATDEILTEVCVPLTNLSAAYKKESKRPNFTAIVNAAAAIKLDDDGAAEYAAIAMGAVGKTALLANKASSYLIGRNIDDKAIKAAALLAAEEAEPVSDLAGSAEYKLEVVKYLVEDVLNIAVKRLAENGGKA